MASSIPFGEHWLTAQLDDHLTYLYHYARPQKLAAMLDRQVLFMGPYADMNDPRESKELIPVVIPNEGPPHS